jgi:hypothetical protein
MLTIYDSCGYFCGSTKSVVSGFGMKGGAWLTINSLGSCLTKNPHGDSAWHGWLGICWGIFGVMESEKYKINNSNQIAHESVSDFVLKH